MQKYFIPIILSVVLNFFNISAQTTWVKTYDLDDYLNYWHDSTHVGPLEMCVTPNGTIISLMMITRDRNINVMAIDTMGNVLWNIPVGASYTMQTQSCYNLLPTPDNGCMFIRRHDVWGVSVTDKIFRLGANGQTIFSKEYPQSYGYNHDLVEGIALTEINSTLITFSGDSLVEIDSVGNYIRNRTPFNSKIVDLPDSTFLSYTLSNISREDFNGNLIWTVGISNTVEIFPDTDFIYTRNFSTVSKIHTSNGNLVWTKPILSRDMSMTSDLGFVVCQNNEILKYDSAGILQWNKIYPFPQIGFRAIASASENTYICGGSWLDKKLVYTDTFYHSFLTRIDSIGNGVIDSTSLFYCGNANDNYKLGFGDDAVYVAAAMGKTGPAREAALNQFLPTSTVYATNWPDSFPAGINYKFSDCNGDGHIDTADITSMQSLSYQYPLVTKPHWYRQTHSFLPDLNFLLRNNNLNSSDTITIDVVLASQLVPVDSIYGLSFDFHFSGSTSFSYAAYSIKPTSLGDTSTNLYVNYSNFSHGPTCMVLCRNDHQNATVAGDTIATLYFMIQFTFDDTITCSANYNAITADGYEIPLNANFDSLFFTLTTGIQNYHNQKLTIFPQPASSTLNISLNSTFAESISIYSVTGKLIYLETDPKLEKNIDVSDIPDGTYFLKIVNGQHIYNSPIIILH